MRRWDHVKDVLVEALAQTPDKRAAFVQEACGSDHALSQDVLKLIGAHDRAGTTLESPILFPVIEQRQEHHPPRFPPLSVVARRFRILRLIARGGMGEVYEAEDLQLGVRVALKTIRSGIAADARVLVLFKNEIQTARRVTHPNVCRIYDLAQHTEPTADGSEQVTMFLTMELLAGETLSDYLKQHGPLAQAEALPLIEQIASGLQAAHEAGVIHRDFKPGNVMLVPTTGAAFRAVVTDFGLAVPRMPTDFQPLPSGGTPAYMAPEQIRGGEITTATDVYALGLVIAEMIGAFVKTSGASWLHTSVPRSGGQSGLRLHVPRPFRRWEPVLRRCVEADPAKRYSRPLDVAQALKTAHERKHAYTRPELLAAVAGMLAIFAMAASVWRLHPVQPADVAVVPLTAYPGIEQCPTFAPDGNRVAFYWDGGKPGQEGIYVKEIGADPPTLLARTTHGFPAWSPDGRLIAFTGPIPGDCCGSYHCGVYVVPDVGGIVRKVGEIAGQAWVGGSGGPFVAWHPNGKWLVTTDRTAPGESFALFLMPLEGGAKRRLTSPKGILGDLAPAVSSDGRAVVFTRFNAVASGSLELLELDPYLNAIGEPRRLLPGDRFYSYPAWMPNGRSILYTGGDIHNQSLFRMELLPRWRPGRVERLAFAGEGVWSPAVSRQGRLAFAKSSRGGNANIWRLELRNGRWNGRPPVKLVSSTRISHAPVYSPDGAHIAFVSNRSGNYEIWVCDRDGSHATQLTSEARPEQDVGIIRWSSDSRSLYVVFAGKPHFIGVEGGRPKEVAEYEAGSLSRDGRWIYFGSKRSGKRQIWKMPAGGGHPTQVTKHGGDGPGLESPDGRFLYYTSTRGKEAWPDVPLWRVPADGGAETQVVKSVLCGIDFAVAHRGIYFIPGDGPRALQFLDLATNRVENVAALRSPQQDPVCGLSLSPDGRYVLYALMEHAGWETDLMLAEGFQ